MAASTHVRHKTRNRLIWLVLGIIALVGARILRMRPDLAEKLYGEGLFPVIRNMFDYSTGWLPVPFFWVLVPLLLWRFWRSAMRPLLRGQVRPGSFLLGTVSTVAACVFLFYALWGFNYARDDIATRLSLSAPPLEMDALAAEFERATAALVAEVNAFENDIREHYHLANFPLESTMREVSAACLESIGFPLTGRVRGRLLGPKGILLSFNTAGVYIPFSGEGHVDAGMLPIQLPFTLSHEMMHAYGVTDEGDCNFLAYLACTRSDIPFVRYSGLLSYWRYVASEYRRAFPEAYQEVRDSLPGLVQQSLQDIRANLDKYPEIMPQVRNAVYDSYLKSHGVAEGLKSYSRVVRMVHAYTEQTSDTQ